MQMQHTISWANVENKNKEKHNKDEVDEKKQEEFGFVLVNFNEPSISGVVRFNNVQVHPFFSISIRIFSSLMIMTMTLHERKSLMVFFCR